MVTRVSVSHYGIFTFQYFLVDIDECTTGAHTCHPKAKCTNVVGLYICLCLSGYTGDGERNCVEG